MANNLNIGVNLLKLKAAVMGVKSPKTGEIKKCVIIPIEDNDLYNKVDENGKVSVFLNVTAWENRQTSQYGDTHMVKQSHSKEWNEAHTDEDRRNQPILGNASPVKEKNLDNVNVPEADVEMMPLEGEADDLPF